jgi:Cof subfamily protein (haloacid dehalogenase superfamily)
MKKYRVVVSDLDGTLLNEKKEISEENLLAIREMTERGVHFVASSGRSLDEMPTEIIENPYIRYISCSDGAVIYDKTTGEAIVKNYMPIDVVRECVKILRDYEILPMTHGGGKLYIDRDGYSHENYVYHNVTPAFEKVNGLLGIRVDDCLSELESSDEAELFCAFFRSSEELSECVERLLALGDVKIAASEKYNIEIYHKSAGKGRALYPLAEFLGCDISEIIAVGDSKNDVEMVEEAGLGLAMSNSMEELKAIADEVICSNEEHAAKYILENYIK